MPLESMPLTIGEQLEALEVGDNLPIDRFQRSSWQTKIWDLKRKTKKRFSIRTARSDAGQPRVWRLEDAK